MLLREGCAHPHGDSRPAMRGTEREQLVGAGALLPGRFGGQRCPDSWQRCGSFCCSWDSWLRLSCSKTARFHATASPALPSRRPSLGTTSP
ncbi:hypothetical protein Y1Q_0012370 [Alligator mississippiensis]|uniref:Uncharacterized protein n=1 Tax=Alligator mississippiensis TaxID=8496 RepID=A0A151MRQ3_ALLMI|nr:hypothetical protein Y1Q_0012370 [Alligator mississippiensis]